MHRLADRSTVTTESRYRAHDDDDDGGGKCVIFSPVCFRDSFQLVENPQSLFPMWKLMFKVVI